MSNGNALLSEEEAAVLKLVVQGYKNEEISDKLDVSLYIVKATLARLFEKFDVSDRLELVLYAVYHKLVAKPEVAVA